MSCNLNLPHITVWNLIRFQITMSSKNIELNRNIETLYNNLAGDAAEIPHLSIINPNSFVVRVHNENIRHQLKLEAEIQKLYEDKIENFAPTVGDVR